MKKICNTCKVEKEIVCFTEQKSNKDGYRNKCKGCASIYYKKNSEKIKKSSVKYYHANSQRILEKDKKARNRKEESKRYRENNKEKIKIKKKEYYQKNKERLNAKSKKWAELNSNKSKEIRKKSIKKWRKKNKDHVLSYKRDYSRSNKEIVICRSIVQRAIKYKNIKKIESTINLLGYSPKKLRQRIECQFKEGMSWKNYGEWHIDHKKAITNFSKDTPVNIINALSNLQPLWALDNISKGNKRIINNID